MQWQDIDLDECKVHIGKQFTRHYDVDHEDGKRSTLGLSTPKTKGSVRDIYICESFAKELKAYKEKMIEWKKKNKFIHSEEDFVFVGVKNAPIEPRVFYKYYKDVLEEAGIEDANFHTLRHTFTTRCIEQGMDILAVARTLGHADIKMTLNRYSHLLPQHMRASMAMMEDHYY